MAVQPIRFRVKWGIYNPGDIASFSPEMVRRLTSPILIHGQPPAPPVADRYLQEEPAPAHRTVEDISRTRIIDEEHSVMKVPTEEPKAPTARKPRGGGKRRDGTPRW